MSGEGQTYKLAGWYSSEIAKRNLGKICDAIFHQQKVVHLLGTEAEPLLELGPPPVKLDDEEISIDEARADWSNVTLAAAIYGTQFRIQGRRSTPARRGLVLAILRRHSQARHPAERYLRAQSTDAEQLARQIEALALDVRKLGRQTSAL